jgi:catechol 2,3-dioxygenase-like lactoylglutathione lyase family enzyme
MWGGKNFYFGDNISVGVKNLDLAVAWYQDKLGLRLTPVKSILFTKKIEAAYEEFSSKGISVEPIQSDSGGNRFFRFRDLEGNAIEVCREP